LLSFGVKISNNWKSALGLSMKLHYSNLNINEEHEDNYTGNSIVVDIGWLASISNQFKLGIKIQNSINPVLNWSIDTGDGLPSTYTEEYPLIISIGSSYKSKNTKHHVMFQEDIMDMNGNIYYLTKIGYEYLYLDHFSLRFGLKGTDDFRLGFGYIFNISDKFPLVLDYSLDLGSENEGISHLFTWSFNL